MNTHALLHDAELVYLYDGSFEGYLTAVFQAFKLKHYPANITVEDGLQLSLLGSYIPILPCLEEAERVRTSMITKLGSQVYQDVTCVFLSDHEEKGGIILRYLQYLFKKGRKARAHLAHPAVQAFEAVLSETHREAHYFKMFVRFAHTQGGVYFSQIDPKAAIVPLVMDHFAERFNVQPFMLYDSRHAIAGVFDTKTWWLVDTAEQGLTVPAHSQQEECFQSLWQTFFDTIAIEERKNPTCQRNFMPKRFWGNMCEHIPPQLRKQNASTETPTAAAKRLTASKDLVLRG